MANNVKEAVANHFRSLYRIPLSEPDDDVIEYAHSKDPQELADYTEYSQGGKPGLRDQHPYAMALQDAADRIKPVADAAQAGAGKALGAVADAAEKVPGLREAGKAGAGMQDYIEQLRQKSLGTGFEPLMAMVGGSGGPEAGEPGAAGMSSLIPNTALGAGLAAAPLLGKGAGMASEALAPAEGVVGGPLGSKAAMKNVGALGKVMSGTPELSYRSALENPSILLGTETPEQVGAEMNKWASHPSLGVKTGSEARNAIPDVAGEISPRLGTGHGAANETWQKIHEIEARADQLHALRDHFDNADQIAEDMNTMKGAPKSNPGSSLTDQEAADVSAGGTRTVDDVRKSIAQRAAPLMEQNKKDLQDLLSARSVAGNLRSAPGLASPTEAIDAKLATQNLNRLDDAITNTANSLKPGSGDEYNALRDRYHGAMIRKEFSPLLAQNANHSPSVLRVMAALSPALKGNVLGAAGGLAAESPAAAARMIRSAAFMRDFGATAPSKAAGALADLAPSAQTGVGTGALSSLFNRKDEEQGK